VAGVHSLKCEKLDGVWSSKFIPYVSTQSEKLPGPEWSSPIRVQVPELVWGSSHFGPGLIFHFLSLRPSEAPGLDFQPLYALQ
jgi:hypothetical protein